MVLIITKHSQKAKDSKCVINILLNKEHKKGKSWVVILKKKKESGTKSSFNKIFINVVASDSFKFILFLLHSNDVFSIQRKSSLPKRLKPTAERNEEESNNNKKSIEESKVCERKNKLISELRDGSFYSLWWK